MHFLKKYFKIFKLENKLNATQNIFPVSLPPTKKKRKKKNHKWVLKYTQRFKNIFHRILNK